MKCIINFLGDMYRGTEEEEEPEWVKNEKEQFSSYRDKDHNGYMDFEEVSKLYKNFIDLSQ